MKNWFKFGLGGERGSGQITMMIFTVAGSAVVAAGLMQFNQTLKAKKSLDSASKGRERNDAAIRYVQQLANTKAIVYSANSVVKAQGVPALEGGKTSRWTIENATAMKVWICDKPTGKDRASTAEDLAFCGKDLISVPTSVVFISFTDRNGKAFGNVLAETSQGVTRVASGKSEYQKTPGVIEFGMAGTAKEEAFAWNTDFCFYIKPKGGHAGGITYVNGQVSKDDLRLIEPRANGTKGNQYAKSFKLKEGSGLGGSVQVLKNFRPFLDFYYNQGYRGVKLDITDASSKTKEIFTGVMPRIPNGPQFEYFLRNINAGGDTNITPTDPRSVELNKPVTVWDPEAAIPLATNGNLSEYQAGCARTTGSFMGPDGTTRSADFCTKVNVPFMKYGSQFTKKCVAKKHIVRKGEIFRVSRAVQSSCDPTWPATTRAYVAANEGRVDLNIVEGGLKTEFTITDYIAMNEGNLTGMTPQNIYFNYLAPIGGYVEYFGGITKAAAAAITATPVPTGSPVAAASVTPNATPVVDDSTDPANIADDTQVAVIPGTQVSFWDLDDIRPVGAQSYDSSRCVYFRYYDMTNAKKCQVQMIDAVDGSWVCRNADGCFSKETKIRMADGSDKFIYELDISDKVFNPKTGNSVGIKKLSVGPEFGEMFKISSGFNMVDVTREHPFLTSVGWKQAKDIKVGDELMLAFGDSQKVESVERHKPATPPDVFNLQLDAPESELDDHFVLANGVITGDLLIQQSLAKGKLK